MNKTTQLEIEHDCRALIAAFSYYIDHREYDALTALFALEGVWFRHGVRNEGHAQILAALQQRPANQFTRHVTAATHFSHVDENTAHAVSYNLSYFSLDPSEMPMRYQPQNLMVVDFKDTFIKTADGWRFLERDSPFAMIPDHIREMLAGGH